ncbi:MAG: DEAD/DEAH box helicase [Desulfurococcaceae archaeon]
MAYTVEVEPVCVELGEIKIRGKEEFTLRRFQEDLVGFFSSPRIYLFLSAPTGSGKTFTLLAPLISNVLHGTGYDGALGVYPTKPLTADQFESLKFTLGKLGEVKSEKGGVVIYELNTEVESGDNRVASYRGKVGLALLTRDNIEKLRESMARESGRSVLDAVRRVLIAGDVDYLITLAVPEYPYLMLSHMYRSHHDLAKVLDLACSGKIALELAEKALSLMENEDELRKFTLRIAKMVKKLVEGRTAERELADLSSALLPPVLFFDEFHTWSFYELPTAVALVLLHRLTSLMSTRREMYRVVFSSATPNQRILDIVRKIAGEYSVEKVEVNPVDCGRGSVAMVKGKTMVELYPVETNAYGALAWFEVDKSLPSVVENKAKEIVEYKRAMILGRRVYSVEKAAESFHRITGKTPAVVTGVVPPPGFYGKNALVERRATGELYVFGNYAVELGVDLQNIRYSIVVASNLGELVQRMGRSGRGNVDSKSVVLVPRCYIDETTKKLKSRSTVSYRELVEAFSWIMPDEHIVRKQGNKVILNWNIGKLRVYLPLATHVLILFLRYKDKPMDLKPVLQDFVNTAGVLGFNREFFSWINRRVSRNQEVLVELAAFRLSPTVPYTRYIGEGHVDGEANPVTLLSNYDVELDTSGGFRVVIGKPSEKSVKNVSEVNLNHPNRSLMFSLNDTVLPFKLLLEILGGKRLDNNVLIRVLKEINAPVYFIYTRVNEKTAKTNEVHLLEILHVYGQAIALKHSGDAYAYMLLL